MLFKEVIDLTRDRYARREGPRNTSCAQVEAGAPLEADTPERVQKRMRRLAAKYPLSEPAAMALERIMGKSDLMSVNYLEMGLQAARCVGRITIRTGTGRNAGFGSGFTISPRLLITNNHVLGSPQEAAASRVEFNYQEDATGQLLTSVVLDLRPDVFFLTDERLDYTVVAVSERSTDGVELGGFAWLPLIEEEGKVIIGEYVNIIQHPNGEPKQLALRENQLVDLLPDFLHYHTDTAPGSSGSPVFNDQWEVVGLHHSGVPRLGPNGEILTRDGLPWREEMGEHRIDWLANEGVRASRIVQSIRAAALGPDQARLRSQMFEAMPAPAPIRCGPVEAAPAGPVRREAHLPAVAADGTATWTVPVEIRVRLGAPAAPADAGPDIRPGGVADGSAGGVADGGVTGDGGTGGLSGDAGGMAGAGAEPEAVREALRELERARQRPYYDAAEDARARDAYYGAIRIDAGAAETFRSLSALLRGTHATEPGYRPMRHLYPWVDLHPDLSLRSVYSGKAFGAAELIRADAEVEAERRRLVEAMRPALAESSLRPQSSEALVAILEASLPYNCEHAVPQSWFGRAEPMRGDLHHLFACESGCNSFRGNFPYFDFPDYEEAVRGECGKREAAGFEPSNGKGVVARATLYFLLRYPGAIDPGRGDLAPRIDTLLAWHAARPPSDYERHRNAAIFAVQGNRNPLIDHPEWADRIDFGPAVQGGTEAAPP